MALRGVSRALDLDHEAVFLVDLDEFQGPLDLLLHLIREQDIDIFDIPIARITAQFLAAIEGIEPGEIDHAGEFLEMAATLVRIKVQMLLPSRDEEEEDDPRAELVRRLLEYEQIREVVSRFEVAESERSRKHAKGWVEERPEKEEESEEPPPLKVDWEDVEEAAMAVGYRRFDPEDHRIARRPVAVEDKMELIEATLRRVSRVEFGRLVRPWRSRLHGVATLMASLEMARRRLLALRQTRPFADLWLYRREGGEADGAEEAGTAGSGGEGSAPEGSAAADAPAAAPEADRADAGRDAAPGDDDGEGGRSR